jgi:hypothetical protein
MQLFVVYSNRETLGFTIPGSERKHGKSSFLRATQAPDNELLLEVTDSRTKGFDRACVVFRPDARKESANDRYDASKLFNRSGGVSQIWFPTGAPANKDLSVSVISNETSELELSWLPSSAPQLCTITAYRRESLTAPEQLILLDRQTGVKTDLLDTPSYTFDSGPGDRTDRFVLLFKSSTKVGDAKENTLACYYEKADKSIRITGLDDADAGSTIAVYDVQGRRIMHSPVGNGIIPFAVNEGVYIVKIAGNRGLSCKILVK